MERLESLCLEITNFMTARQVEMTVENSEEKLQQEIEQLSSELSAKENLVETLKQLTSRWHRQLETLSQEQKQLQEVTLGGGGGGGHS